MIEINEALKDVKFINFLKAGNERLISFVFDFESLSIFTKFPLIESIADKRAQLKDHIYIDILDSKIYLELKFKDGTPAIKVMAPPLPTPSPPFNEMQWKNIQVELVISQLLSGMPNMLRSESLQKRVFFSGCVFNSLNDSL